jgi:hypothetical protein
VRCSVRLGPVLYWTIKAALVMSPVLVLIVNVPESVELSWNVLEAVEYAVGSKDGWGH